MKEQIQKKKQTVSAFDPLLHAKLNPFLFVIFLPHLSELSPCIWS